jgi:hypothetical protein
MALRNILILRKPRSGCLEGRTALLPADMPNRLHLRDRANYAIVLGGRSAVRSTTDG